MSIHLNTYKFINRMYEHHNALSNEHDLNSNLKLPMLLKR